MKTDKHSPEDILDALEEQEVADEAERVASLSAAEVDAGLAGAGIDAKAVRAGARDVVARAVAKRAESVDAATEPREDVVAAAPSPARPTSSPSTTQTPTATATPLAKSQRGARNVVVMPRRAVRWVLALAAAAGFAALIIAERSAIVAWFGDTGEPTPPVTHPNDSLDEPGVLRRDAAKAIAASEWGKAIELLDRAKELDPRGDEAPDVQEARRFAQRMRERK